MVRRYTPIKPSRGTVWPDDVRRDAMRLHGGCIGPRVGMPDVCLGAVELDHVRASGGIGLKSRSTLDNAAPLCGRHHQAKTLEGRRWRPLLCEYIERAIRRKAPEHVHVDPVYGCPECYPAVSA